ncbi:MAG: LysR family transcriptional regulator [Burkholderiales bacterium]|nr:LysR family transcriptional regulator [Burkholderiales bacterium]
MIDDILLFIVLYETHNFTLVAEQLNIQQSTVSKRISKLEYLLGNSLITRRGKNFEITAYGVYIYNKFRHFPLYIENTLNGYQRNSCHDSNETITVSLPFILSYEILSQHIEVFMKSYPNVKLNILYEKDIPNFNIVNFAITRHNIEQPGFITSFFRREHAHLYCSNQYAQKHGIPESIDDLKNRKLINLILDHNQYIVSMVNTKTNQEILPNFDSRIYVDNVMHMKEIGIHAMEHLFGCWDFMCIKEFAAGELIQVLPDWNVHTLNFYLIQKSNMRSIDKIFLNFISEKLGYHFMNKDV